MTERAKFSDFSGGINTNSPADQLEDNEVVDALNVVFDKRSNLVPRKGLTLINSHKNLWFWTEQFDNAFWLGSSPVTPDTDNDPNGNLTADTLEDTSSASTQGKIKSLNQLALPISEGDLITSSIHIKESPLNTYIPMFSVKFSDGSIVRSFRFYIEPNSGELKSAFSSGFTNIDFGVLKVSNYWRIYLTVKIPYSTSSFMGLEVYPAYISKTFFDSMPTQRSEGSGFVVSDDTQTGSHVFWGVQVEKGTLSEYHKVEGSVSSDRVFPTSKITSILDYNKDDGTQALVCTSGSDILRLDTTNDWLESIKGSLNLPNDTYWQWVIYDNVALGVNGADEASGKDSFIKIDGISSDAEVLEYSRNKILYSEQFQTTVWNKILGTVVEANKGYALDNVSKTADRIKDDSINLEANPIEFDKWTVFDSALVEKNTDFAPDGTKTADTVEDGQTGFSSRLGASNVNIQNNEVYVVSVYVKKTTDVTSHFPLLLIQLTGGSTQVPYLTIDTNNGVVTENGATGVIVDSGILETANYWRVWIKINTGAHNNTTMANRIYPAGTATSTGTTSVTPVGKNVFWGYQAEKLDYDDDELSDFEESKHGIYQDIEVEDGDEWIASVHIKKTSAVSEYPVLRMEYLGGTTELEAGVIVDTQNGTTTNETGNAPDSSGVVDETTHWRVWLKFTNNSTGNETLRFSIYPAYASGLTGALDHTATGSNIFWGAQVEKESSITPYKKNEANAHIGEPPNAKYIEVWNNRIWIIDADEPNVVRCSALADFEDWTTPGIAGSQSFEIGGEDGEPCTGLKAHKDRLFIFKTNKVYFIAPGSPNTDINQYEVILLNKSIGCLSGYSIQAVLDDLVFLSKYGLASLAAVEKFGDFEQAIVSRNIQELSEFKMDETNSASVINPSESQYWIAAPLETGTRHNQMWVMDFTRIQERTIGFTRFNEEIMGASFAPVEYEGQRRIYVGSYVDNDSGYAFLYRYGDDGVYNDAGKLYDVFIKTKAHNLGDNIDSKIFHRVYLVLELLSDELELGISYIFDEDQAKVKSWVQEFTGEVFNGALWDVAEWDDASYAVQRTLERRVKRKVLGSPGRLAKTIQVTIANTIKDQAFLFKEYGFDYDPASHHKD